MKLMKNICLFLAMIVLGGGSIQAQFVTTHAKSSLPGQQNGIYYSLPRTVLQLDFVIEETELFEGPYSNYVNYIGADDFVVEDGKEYKIKEVRMQTHAESDPNAIFFIAMSPKKDNQTIINLTSSGILRGVGLEGLETVPTTNFTTSSPIQGSSEGVSFKYQYGASGTRGEEQMARAAADMITKIRDEKLKLITGFQETAFTLDTYRQMYNDLEEMENDYLSLFIGKKLTRTFVKTLYVIPNKEVNTQSIAKFSKEEGLTTGTSGAGSVITIQTQSLQTTSTINAPSQSAVESLSLENKLFYRVPEIANVKVNLGGQTLLERRETIAQYGVFLLAPLNKTKLSLDPETGQVISIGME